MTRLSAEFICADTSITNGMYALKTGWTTPLCVFEDMRGDKAFNEAEFITFVKSIDVNFGPIPSRRSRKGVLKAKYGILHSISIRLSCDDCTIHESLKFALAFDVTISSMSQT